MTDQTLPRMEAQARVEPASKEKMLVAVLLGVGAIATFGWVALIGWGVIYLIGAVTG